MTMRGVNREVVPPERIVRTESFEFGCDPQAGEQVGTLVLTERDGGGGGGGGPGSGKTTLTLTLLYPSKEASDATIASGMEQGVAAGYDRLDELLASRANKHDLVVTRVFDAPVKRVWQAWTDPEQVMR